MPKLNKFQKLGEDILTDVSDHTKTHILSTFRAIERFVMLSCIAMGLLQIIAVCFSDDLNKSLLRWLRTKLDTVPSEATTADFMRKSIFLVYFISVVQTEPLHPSQFEVV